MTLPSPDMVSPVPLSFSRSLTSPHQINEVNCDVCYGRSGTILLHLCIVQTSVPAYYQANPADCPSICHAHVVIWLAVARNGNSSLAQPDNALVLQTLNPQKPVWAALHDALDSPGTTILAAWLALDIAWTAMTGPNTAEESLSHMQHMASSLQCLATAPGWTKLNFPMGLSMAVMLHIQRYLISTSTVLCAEVSEPPFQLVIGCTYPLSVHEIPGLQSTVKLPNVTDSQATACTLLQ